MPNAMLESNELTLSSNVQMAYVNFVSTMDWTV